MLEEWSTEALRKLLHNGSDPLQIQFNIERAHPTARAPRGLKPHGHFSINSREEEKERERRESREIRSDLHVTSARWKSSTNSSIPLPLSKQPAPLINFKKLCESALNSKYLTSTLHRLALVSSTLNTQTHTHAGAQIRMHRERLKTNYQRQSHLSAAIRNRRSRESVWLWQTVTLLNDTN